MRVNTVATGYPPILRGGVISMMLNSTRNLMNERAKPKFLWFRLSILFGLLLGLLLLVQTVLTYRYVSRSLVRQEAQREADRRMQSIGRAARLTGSREALRAIPAETVARGMIGAARRGTRGIYRYTYPAILQLAELRAHQPVPGQPAKKTPA